MGSKTPKLYLGIFPTFPVKSKNISENRIRAESSKSVRSKNFELKKA